MNTNRHQWIAAVVVLCLAGVVQAQGFAVGGGENAGTHEQGGNLSMSRQGEACVRQDRELNPEFSSLCGDAPVDSDSKQIQIRRVCDRPDCKGLCEAGAGREALGARGEREQGVGGAGAPGVLIGAEGHLRPTGETAATQRRPTEAVPAGDGVYWQALAVVESGGDDGARGRHGEISRYQILRPVWRRATGLPYRAALDPEQSLVVARCIMWDRTMGRELSPAEFARAWHCPNRRHLGPGDRDYVRRFCNVVEELTTNGHQ